MFNFVTDNLAEQISWHFCSWFNSMLQCIVVAAVPDLGYTPCLYIVWIFGILILWMFNFSIAGSQGLGGALLFLSHWNLRCIFQLSFLWPNEYAWLLCLHTILLLLVISSFDCFPTKQVVWLISNLCIWNLLLKPFHETQLIWPSARTIMDFPSFFH